jgi:hypothetical protein
MSKGYIYKIFLMEEQEMAVKKATVADAMAKVTAKATETKTEAPKATEKKAAPAKKAEAPKAAEKKAAPAKKAEAPKAAEKKAAPAKKTASAAKATENVYIEYAGGQVSTADLVARATAASGKKSIKALNVYYQPETNMVYFTADGEEGSFAY